MNYRKARVFLLTIVKDKATGGLVRQGLNGNALLQKASEDGLELDKDKPIQVQIHRSIETGAPLEIWMSPNELEQFPNLKKRFNNDNVFMIEMGGVDYLKLIKLYLDEEDSIVMDFVDTDEILKRCEAILKKEK